MRQTDAMMMSGMATRLDAIPFASRRAMSGDCILAAVSPLLLMLVLAVLYRNTNRTGIADSSPLISVAEKRINRGDLPSDNPKVQGSNIQSQTRPEKLSDSGNS